MPKGAPHSEIPKLPGFAQLREAVKAHQAEHKGHAGSVAAYPLAVKEKTAKIVKVARERRLAITTVLSELGLATSALNWPSVRVLVPRRQQANRMRPVKIGHHGRGTSNHAGDVTVTTPEGYQVEGSVDTIAALLKSLSGGKG